MKNKRFLLIGCLLLAACQNTGPAIDPDKLLKEMLPLASGDMLVLEQQQINDLLFIEDDTVCVGATSMNQTPSEIILCQGEDKTVKQVLEDRLTSLKASASMYFPETIRILDEAICEKKGNVWVMIVDENQDSIQEIINNYNK